MITQDMHTNNVQKLRWQPVKGSASLKVTITLAEQELTEKKGFVSHF